MCMLDINRQTTFLQIFCNWTHQNIPDRQHSVHFWKSKKKSISFHPIVLYCACCRKSISSLACRSKSINYIASFATCCPKSILSPAYCAKCEIIYLTFRVMQIQMTITISLVRRYSRYSRHSTALIFKKWIWKERQGSLRHSATPPLCHSATQQLGKDCTFVPTTLYTVCTTVQS